MVFLFLFSNRTFRKQTMEILIRHCVLRCLVWVCTVCLCPTKRTLGLYGLNNTSTTTELTAAEVIGEGDLNAFNWRKIFALDYVVVKTQRTCVSRMEASKFV